MDTYKVSYDQSTYAILVNSYVEPWEDGETIYEHHCFRDEEKVAFAIVRGYDKERSAMTAFFEVAIDYAQRFHAPKLSCYGLEIIER